MVKQQTSQDETNQDDRQSSSFPPMPDVNRIVEPPFNDFGSGEDLGAPIDSSVEHSLNWARPQSVGTSNSSSMRPAYFEEDIESSQPQDSTSPKSSDETEETIQPTKRSRSATYKCSKCGAENDSTASECSNCGEKRSWGNLWTDTNKNKWKCTACYVQNDDRLDKCACCETARPGAKASSSSGSASASAPAAAGAIGSDGFSFGGSTSLTTAAAPATSGGFPFDTGAIGSGGFLFGASTSSTTTTGSTSNATGFSFASTAPAADTTKEAGNNPGFISGDENRGDSSNATGSVSNAKK